MLITLTGGFLDPSLCPDVSKWLISDVEFQMINSYYTRPVIQIDTPEELFEFINCCDDMDYSVDIIYCKRTSTNGTDVLYSAALDYTGH
jgi:hypothetical protein